MGLHEGRHTARRFRPSKLNVAGSRPVSRSTSHFVPGTTLSLIGARCAEADESCCSAQSAVISGARPYQVDTCAFGPNTCMQLAPSFGSATAGPRSPMDRL